MKLFAIVILGLVFRSLCNNVEKTVANEESLNHYNYTSNGTVCLMVSIKAHFQMGNMTYNVSKNSNVDASASECGKLVVNFDKNTFSLVFNETSDKKSYFLNEVSAKISNQTFTNDSLSWGEVVLDQSYKCAKGLTVLMENVTFYATDLQFQAYKVSNNKYGSSKDCKDLSPIIPIVVAAVLGVLVLIVIVAYLIGRRRSRSGYEEI